MLISTDMLISHNQSGMVQEQPRQTGPLQDHHDPMLQGPECRREMPELHPTGPRS